jgi:hypothetical protein
MKRIHVVGSGARTGPTLINVDLFQNRSCRRTRSIQEPANILMRQAGFDPVVVFAPVRSVVVAVVAVIAVTKLAERTARWRYRSVKNLIVSAV